MLRRNFYMPAMARPHMGFDLLKELDRAFYGKAARDEIAKNSAEEVFEFHSTWNYETENGLTIHIDIPGVNANDFKVEFKDSILSVEAKRTYMVGKDEKVTRTFRERYQIGDQLNGEKVEAHYEDGVLSLYLPKVKKVEPEAVKVQVSTGPKQYSWLDSEKGTIS